MGLTTAMGAALVTANPYVMAITAAGAAVTALGRSFVSTVQQGSALNETINKTRVIFGDAARGVEAFAKGSAAIGVSRNQALSAAAGFGNLFTTMKLGREEAAGMSVDLVKLSADLASFHNLSSDDVLEKLRSGLVGEAEPMRALGVLLDETTVKNKALSMGFKEQSGQLSQAAKVQARYALIMEQTAAAQGDFARTSDGQANATRKIGAAWKSFVESAGMGFAPGAEAALSGLGVAIPALLDAMQPAMARLGTVVTLLGQGIGNAFRTVPTILRMSGVALSGLGAALRFVGQIIKPVTDFFANLWQRLKAIDWQGAWQSVKAWAIGVWSSITERAQPVLEWVRTWATWAMEKLAQGLTWYVNVAIPTTWEHVIKPALEFLGGLAGRAIDWSVNVALPAAWDAVKPALEHLAGLSGRAIDWTINVAAPWAGGAVESGIRWLSGPFWEWASDKSSKAWDWVVDIAISAWDTVKPALDWLSGPFWEWASDKFGKAWDWAWNFVFGLGELTWEIVQGQIDYLKEVWDWASPHLKEAWDWTWNVGVPEYWESEVKPVLDALKAVWDWAGPLVEQVWNWYFKVHIDPTIQAAIDAFTKLKELADAVGASAGPPPPGSVSVPVPGAGTITIPGRDAPIFSDTPIGPPSEAEHAKRNAYRNNAKAHYEREGYSPEDAHALAEKEATDYYGFYRGGSFKVGGRSGRDANLVSMRLTKGEMVDVRTPGQSSGVTINGGVHIHADSYEGGQAAARGFREQLGLQRRLMFATA